MNTHIKLRGLIFISLIIFMLPFLQTCSNNTLKKSPNYEAKTIGLVVDTLKTKIIYNKETKTNDTIISIVEVGKPEKEEIIKDETAKKEVWLEKTKKEYTLNLYSLGFAHYNEFEFRYLRDKTFNIFLNFTLIVILTISMLVLSFNKKYKLIMIISSVNLLLLFIATVSLCLIEIIKDFNQIKYGYYIFVLNSIIIIIESRKEKNKMKNKEHTTANSLSNLEFYS